MASCVLTLKTLRRFGAQKYYENNVFKLGFVLILEKQAGSQLTSTTFREEAEELNGRLEKVKENGIKEDEKIYHQNDQWKNFSSTAHIEGAVSKGNQLEELEFVRNRTFRTKGILLRVTIL